MLVWMSAACSNLPTRRSHPPQGTSRVRTRSPISRRCMVFRYALSESSRFGLVAAIPTAKQPPSLPKQGNNSAAGRLSNMQPSRGASRALMMVRPFTLRTRGCRMWTASRHASALSGSTGQSFFAPAMIQFSIVRMSPAGIEKAISPGFAGGGIFDESVVCPSSLQRLVPRILSRM